MLFIDQYSRLVIMTTMTSEASVQLVVDGMYLMSQWPALRDFANLVSRDKYEIIKCQGNKLRKWHTSSIRFENSMGA